MVGGGGRSDEFRVCEYDPAETITEIDSSYQPGQYPGLFRHLVYCIPNKSELDIQAAAEDSYSLFLPTHCDVSGFTVTINFHLENRAESMVDLLQPKVILDNLGKWLHGIPSNWMMHINVVKQDL